MHIDAGFVPDNLSGTELMFKLQSQWHRTAAHQIILVLISVKPGHIPRPIIIGGQKTKVVVVQTLVYIIFFLSLFDRLPWVPETNPDLEERFLLAVNHSCIIAITIARRLPGEFML